ncbi:60S ribosomal protein L27-B [Cucumispora dikerogammari]|nr:60S ribosomal protein L27-B [Cucumispora dikerogammari]
MTTTAIFNKNDLVMNTQGRFAGKRGIVLDVNPTRVIVAGISKFHPLKKTSKSKYAKFFKTKKTEVFIKKMNPLHLFPSGQNTDLGIKINLETCFANPKTKLENKKLLTEIFNENIKNDKAKWIYEAFNN